MGKLTYSQLEGVWIQGGGQSSLAPLMAAIALAESGGNPDALNGNDNGGRQSSYGLWQISTGTHTPPASNWSDPVENARLAVGKLKSQGLGAWGTYSSGAYKPFLKNGVAATSVSDSASATVSAQDASATFNSANCAWQISWPSAAQTVTGGLVGSSSPSCLLSKTQLRDIIAIALMGSALVVGIAALAIMTAQTFARTPVVGAAVKGLAHVA